MPQSDHAGPTTAIGWSSTVTDVTLGQLLRLPWDYRRAFGRDPDTQLVVDAVRASISVPYLYEPVTLSDLRTGRVSTLIDGGVLSKGRGVLPPAPPPRATAAGPS